VRVERVLGYDSDGRPCHVLFVDGVQMHEVTCYELDPDDQLLRGDRDRRAEWLELKDEVAAAASPAAAELICRWAAQTAEHGAVDDLDTEVETDPRETT
jgi:hypothetical protein